MNIFSFLSKKAQDSLKVNETTESKMAKVKKKISSPLVKRKANGKYS